MASLSVGIRLAAGFGVLMALAVLQGTLGLYYLSTLNDRVEQIYSREVIAIKDIARAKSDLYSMRLDAARLVAETDAEAAQELTGRIDKARTRLSAWVRDHETAALGPVEKKLAASFATRLDTFTSHLDNALRGRRESAALSRDGERAFAKADSLLNDVVDYNDHSAQTRHQYAVADYELASTIIIALCGVIFALSCAIAFLATKSVTRPLQVAMRVADRVAAGDLATRVQVMSRDEFGRVLESMQNMIVQLAGLVRKVRDCSGVLGTSASRLAEGSTELAKRTEQQVASLEETSSSVEEITAAVKQNAEHSAQANRLMAATNQTVTDGAATMDAVLSNMAQVYASADKIAGISHVISEIAFQTNILALNAAVEAAHAGDRGQGFAVVAAEVRSLAARSAGAAKEVKALIDDSLEKVGAGKTLGQDAVGRMNDIAKNVRNAGGVLEEIALASREQSDGVAYVGQAMSELDHIAQRNLTLVEETAIAARSLQEQANLLEAAVGSFKLDDRSVTDSSLRPSRAIGHESAEAA